MPTESSLRTGPVDGRRVLPARSWTERLISRCTPLAPLTVLAAAPGHGRSTLLARLVAHLEEDGAVVVRLGPHLEPRRVPGLVPVLARALVEEAGWDGQDRSWRHDLPALVERVQAEDRTILLVATETTPLHPQELEELARLLAHCDRLHVVVTSRLGHPLQAPVAEAALEARVLTSGDLAFTEAELAEVAAAVGVAASAAELAVLRRAVGGWPLLAHAVLQDSAATWPRLDTSAVHRHLSALGLEHDLGPETVRDLATLALAGSVTASQWLSGSQRAASSPFVRLRELEVLGLVVKEFPEGAAEPTWTMPEALREAVVAWLGREHPAEVVGAHRRLARLHLENGTLAPALDHAIAAEDWTLVEELWSLHGFALLHRAEEDQVPQIPSAAASSGSVVVEHAHAVLGAVVPGEPRATRLAALRAEYELGQAREGARDRRRSASRAPHLAAYLEQVAALVDGRLERVADLARRIENRISRSSYFSTLGRATGVLGLLVGDRLAEALVTGRATSLSSRGPGEPGTRSLLAALEALVLAHDGRLLEAEEALARSRSLDWDPWNLTPVRGVQALAAARVALQRLDGPALEEAVEDAFRHGADEDLLWPFHVEHAAALEVVRGDAARGLDLVTAAIRTHRPSPLASRVLGETRVNLLCVLGEPNRAQALLDDLGLHLPVARARVLVVSGDLEHAGVLAGQHAWSPTTSLSDRIALLLTQACASPDPETAHATLDQARSLAEPHGLALPYFFAPAALWEGDGVPESVRARLESVKARLTTGVPLVRLTARERLVLRHLAVRDTLAEVAADLTVSVNTVKKQALRVYAKLGVHDRAAALQKAQELGLL